MARMQLGTAACGVFGEGTMTTGHSSRSHLLLLQTPTGLRRAAAL